MSMQPQRVDSSAPAAVPFLNVLEMSARRKAVPYEGSATPRLDGGIDHGFTNLKLHPELIDSVPELGSDPALRGILTAIDRPETGLFSIACESRMITDERGSRLSGYLEFALNCRSAAADAAQYFRIFQSFDGRLRQEGFDESVSFQWVLCPTRFAEAQLDGFAAEVRVDTAFYLEPAEAYECWSQALAVLEATLAGLPRGSGPPIYQSGA